MRSRAARAVAAGIGGLVAGSALSWWLIQPARPGDFYTGFTRVPARSGALIRTQPVTSDVRGANAYRVLYSSRDLRGRPAPASGLVLVPATPPPPSGYPVVAWAHGSSGVARRCAPSGSPHSITETVAGAQEFLDAGYAVVATDYLGLGAGGDHPYLIGDSAARAVLDLVRAAQERADWRLGRRFALWGHSQGGHAALFAAQRAPVHVPEQKLVGVAVAAPATDLAALMRRDLAEPVGRVFGAMALISWSRLFPGADLATIVNARNLPLVRAVAAGCLLTPWQGLVLVPEVRLMSGSFLARDPTVTEPWASIIADNSVPPAGIAAPLLVVQGGSDPVIQPEVSREWVRRVRRDHPAVAYREYPDADHLSVLAAATSDVLAWIGERFTAPGRVRPLASRGRGVG